MSSIAFVFNKTVLDTILYACHCLDIGSFEFLTMSHISDSVGNSGKEQH